MMQIHLTDEAEDDIVNLLFYYEEQAGAVIAQLIQERLYSQLNSLIDFPERIRSSQRIKGTRELVFRGLPYIAFLRLHEQDEIIEVLNIVHTARQFP